MKKRNPVARALRSPALRPKKVVPRKGKGSYSRKRRKPGVSSCN
jgi:stalled ribosome alternative rescue factor ArfA